MTGRAPLPALLYNESVSLPAPTANSKTVVYWRVIYGGDAQHDGRISDCVENTAVDFTDDPGPGDPH